MNRTTKTLVILLRTLVTVCMCCVAGGFLMVSTGGGLIARTFRTDPVAVSQTSSAIADYKLPDGFDSAFSARILGVSMVGYTGVDGHSHIYLFSLPGYLQWVQGEIENQLRQATSTQWSSRPERMQVVDRATATIRGQEVTLLVSEGVNHDNQAYRQVSGVFDGKNGATFVVYESPVSQWDQSKVDEFLTSIQ